MITLTFLQNKKLICCSAFHFKDISTIANRFASSENIATECGNLLMNLTTMADLTTAKNKDANQFGDDFMANFDSFFADFEAELENLMEQSTPNKALSSLESLNALCHGFTSTNITPLD